jgi:hypothetical protein
VPDPADHKVAFPVADRDVIREVAGLAVEIRGAVTPVIGYLELISEEGDPASAERHLHWIATIERRMEAMRELNDQVLRVCTVLRDTVNDRAAMPRPGSEAPEG